MAQKPRPIDIQETHNSYAEYSAGSGAHGKRRSYSRKKKSGGVARLFAGMARFAVLTTAAVAAVAVAERLRVVSELEDISADTATVQATVVSLTANQRVRAVYYRLDELFAEGEENGLDEITVTESRLLTEDGELQFTSLKPDTRYMVTYFVYDDAGFEAYVGEIEFRTLGTGGGAQRGTAAPIATPTPTPSPTPTPTPTKRPSTPKPLTDLEIVSFTCEADPEGDLTADTVSFYFSGSIAPGSAKNISAVITVNGATEYDSATDGFAEDMNWYSYPAGYTALTDGPYECAYTVNYTLGGVSKTKTAFMIVTLAKVSAALDTAALPGAFVSLPFTTGHEAADFPATASVDWVLRSGGADTTGTATGTLEFTQTDTGATLAVNSTELLELLATTYDEYSVTAVIDYDRIIVVSSIDGCSWRGTNPLTLAFSNLS